MPSFIVAVVGTCLFDPIAIGVIRRSCPQGPSSSVKGYVEYREFEGSKQLEQWRIKLWKAKWETTNETGII